jgi:hypothetical protein
MVANDLGVTFVPEIAINAGLLKGSAKVPRTPRVAVPAPMRTFFESRFAIRPLT